MKTQITKPVSGKTHYSDEYKQQALEKWRASGRSAAKVAAELGMRGGMVVKWAKMAREPTGAQTARGARSLEATETENRRLREENPHLLEQREILKKSLGILSET